MELAPGIHRIEAPLGERFVAVYLLVEKGDALLIDTGMDDTPRTYIAPYLDQIGLAPSRIRYVLTSHAAIDFGISNTDIVAQINGETLQWTEPYTGYPDPEQVRAILAAVCQMLCKLPPALWANLQFTQFVLHRHFS